MEDYYTIQTPGHHSAMFAELHVLQKQGVMCDVILAAEDGEVMAHKVVLMAASKYFREKLSPVIGPTASKICLKGISVVELANLVKYIYTGKLLVAKETMDITLEISEILELQGVIQGYKEIISYEQLKEPPSNALLSKSEVSPSQTPVSSGTSPGKNSPQKTNTQISKSVEPVNNSTDEQPVAMVPKVSVSSGTQSTATKDPTSAIQSESNKGSNVHVNEQGAAAQAYLAGDASDVNTTQPTSNDFNFDSLYDQQYMDVSAGSQTPSKTPGMSTSQSGLTPPKVQQVTSLSSESQKIAEERAQHQDLLAVAIETLSDVPHLKQQSHQIQPEVDRAVNSISGTDAGQHLSSPNIIGMKPEEESLEDYENGVTSTKTVTMSAGSVNNDLGGKTDVYTVALDPSTIKSPLKMPRPKRSKTVKEKEAEEKAKKYRQIKAVLMSGNTTDTKPLPVQDKEPRRGSRQKNSTIKQDFQYESLSKTKKKTFNPNVILMPKNSEYDHKSGNDSEPKADTISKVVKGRKEEKIRIPKEEKIEAEGDNFGQVVNFDSDSEDDVDGMILPSFVSEDSKNKMEKSRKKTDDVGANLTENQKKKRISTGQCTTRKVDNSKDSKLDTKNSSGKGADKDKQTANVLAETKSPEKQKKADITNEDVSEMKELHDDLHAQNVDEATAERMKSSSTKRKTRTPRKLPLSDEEKGNDSGPDRHDNIPVVRTRRSSRSLNLEKEKESQSLKSDLKLGDDEPKVTESGKRKKLSREALGGNIDCKDKDLSKAAEITIIAQSKVDEKALGEAEMQINDSKSKKIIIVPKYYQPEVRLKNQTSEEMLKLAEELKKGQTTNSQGKEYDDDYEEGDDDDDEEGDDIHDEDDEDDDEMCADDVVEENVNENGGKSGKRKINKLFKCYPIKKRKTDDMVNSTTDESTNKSVKKGRADNVKDKGKNNESTSKSIETLEKELDMKIEVNEDFDEIVNETDEVVNNVEKFNKKGKGMRVKKNVSTRSEKAISSENIDKDKVGDEEESDKEGTDCTVYVCTATGCQFTCMNANGLREHKQLRHDSSGAKEQDDLMGEPVKNAEIGPKTCGECGKTFKAVKILKKHIEYSHTEKEKIKCEHCDFATPYKSSMSTHLMIAHSAKKEMFMCKFCEYGTPLTGNLRKHLFSSHGLIVVTKQHKKSAEFEKFEEGTIITKDLRIFDPETMEVPKTPKRKTHSYNKTDESEIADKTEAKKRARISLSKLPVDDFLKEMMKRHQEYVEKPEKNYSFMSSSIAMATEHPSFPQASPQVRNTRANKIYNMKKLKPTFTVQPEPISGSYGMGNVHGMYQGAATVPQVASEVEVEHDNQPEVVLENVEGDSPTTVLTISEQKGSDGAEMILINQNGKQTIVRSKDFYDTLQATGHDTNQTLGVISALLQAGEQIEIREQEEIVEIQNI